MHQKQINAAITPDYGPVAENTTTSRDTLDSPFIGTDQSVDEATDDTAAQEEVDVPEVTTTAGDSPAPPIFGADEPTEDAAITTTSQDEQIRIGPLLIAGSTAE